ncbi:MAG: RNA-binding protein [Pseudomonadota bacterium]
MASIYVGNLPFTTTQEELEALFGNVGPVQSVKIITDHETGRPRGFGFVEMNKDDARAAVTAINGTELKGRTLRVNEAHQRPPH